MSSFVFYYILCLPLKINSKYKRFHKFMSKMAFCGYEALLLKDLQDLSKTLMN